MEEKREHLPLGDILKDIADGQETNSSHMDAMLHNILDAIGVKSEDPTKDSQESH